MYKFQNKRLTISLNIRHKLEIVFLYGIMTQKKTLMIEFIIH